MEIKAIDHNVNIIGMEKNGKRYAMCCAWVTQVGPEQVICAIGPQSSTGNAIEAGDIIGISNLKREQKTIAFQLGDMERHSADTDKLDGICFRNNDGAIIINNARVEMKGRVIEVLHLKGLEAENIVYVQILEGKENGGDALRISDLGM